MTRKDKVKELVGRGLNSYHAKALQQIDKINKKNKEQNRKISILTNELDNDYLTKTEEGSVVSLEHSKEGMVYLDELQGNTMVNYCTDGSKEMILNGDIDVEGAFITTTEGVDDGIVDVMCEGNTLVNLDNTTVFNTSNSYNLVDNYFVLNLNATTAGNWRTGEVFVSRKPSTTECTFIFNIRKNTLNKELNFDGYQGIINEYIKIPANATGVFVNKVSIKNLESSLKFARLPFTQSLDEGGEFEIGEFIILEGDYTNKPIPAEYFEGMKSVGQDDENGHKIEILSRNKNLWTYGDILGVGIQKITLDKPLNAGTYTISSSTETKYTEHPVMAFLAGDTTVAFQYLNQNRSIVLNKEISTIYLYSNGYNYNASKDNPIDFTNIQIEEGTQVTSHASHASNKKEISLNEPLRGLPNGVKDRFIKIGGKWFIERNCTSVILNGNENWKLSGTLPTDTDFTRFDYSMTNLPKGINSPLICDTLPYIYIHGLASGSPSIKQECITNHSANSTLSIVIKKSRLTNIDKENFKQWLSYNNTEFVHPLETPIYEPLEVGPTLNTYNDVTHMSNNSLIPCNMKIKNSGYNAIIKPSTLYTVVLDTNKVGTIGVNLGGAKVTTTNNVATVTTPATLSDDSLRVSGKGIKGSKLRLLEGDKTNWVPSFFEGMRSCFEDKLQDDGSYKMEILSKQNNIFEIEKFIKDNNLKNYKNGFICDFVQEVKLHQHFKKNKRYILRCDFEIFNTNGNDNWSPILGIVFKDGFKQDIYLHQRNNIIATTGNRTIDYMYIRNPWRVYTNIFNISIHEDINNIDFIEPISNKIQCSSIEPLKKWDRFVFKDGKLMIERYSKKIDLGVDWTLKQKLNTGIYRYTLNNVEGIYSMAETICNTIAKVTQDDISDKALKYQTNTLWYQTYDDFTLEELKKFFTDSNTSLIFKLKEPTYEEIPFELQKIILEGYKNGTLFFDTNIPPTATITYAGETPVASTIKENKVDISKNTEDINENIIPYLMDMDYRVAVLYLQSENISGTMNVSRVFGGVKEMLIRDIKSKRYSAQEYLNRISTYHAANKITIEEMEEIKSVIMEVYNG